MAGWLGIDMGGTASRWLWLGPEGEIRRGTAPGATGLLYDDTRRAAFAAALEAIRAQLPGAPKAAHLGITGAGFTRDPEIDARAAAALGISDVSHENDAELAHRAGFGGGAGHLVIAGTGSVGIGRGIGLGIGAGSGAGPGLAVVGGRGVLVDDRGSASWIALEGFKALYREIDARGRAGPLSALEAAIEARAGGDWEVQRAILYGPDRGRIGLLAPAVAEAAALGCTSSADILTRAGEELAAMAGQLAARLGPAPVIHTGGALALSPLIRAAILRAQPEAGFPALDAPLAAARHAAFREGHAL